MADETPPLDDARLATIRSTIMQALVVGDSDYVENRARIALDELLAAYDRLRAREAAATAIVRDVATKGVTIYSSEGKPEAYIAPETVDAARALLAQE